MNPVRHLRLQVGLTQRLLANAASTGQSAISAYETGSISPTLATLERIAAAVGYRAVITFEPVSPKDEEMQGVSAGTSETDSTVVGSELQHGELWTH